MIRDRDLEQAASELRNLGGDLNLEPEAAAGNRHVADDVTAKRFVSGLDVRQIHVREQVREEGQRLVRKIVVEVQHPRRSPHQEARAIDDIGVVGENRRDHVLDVRWVVLEIRVLHDHDIPCRLRKSGLQRFGFSTVRLMVEDLDRRI